MTTPDTLISRAFQGATGRAHLYSAIFNTVDGPEATRHMTTGVHVVCDLMCVECGTILGWRYIEAYEPEQKYKEGMACLERVRLVEMEGKTSPPELDDATWVVVRQ